MEVEGESGWELRFHELTNGQGVDKGVNWGDVMFCKLTSGLGLDRGVNW